MVMCMLVIVAPPIVMDAWSMAFLLGRHVEYYYYYDNGSSRHMAYMALVAMS